MRKNCIDAQNLPIGVFDSGVGGLTVLKSLQTILPNENFIYLGDSARLPYGTKSRQSIINYVKQANIFFRKIGVKFIVIACNTASSVALANIHNQHDEIPFLGVIEPSAEAACNASHNGNIVVIGTEATIKSSAYQSKLTEINPSLNVIAKSCSLFVALAEEGLIEGAIVEAVVEQYLNPLFSASRKNQTIPNCLLLGCTHFPILLPAIKKILGPKVTIIDSAEATALSVKKQLIKNGLLRPENNGSNRTKFLVTDNPERFSHIAQHFINSQISENDIEVVDIVQ